MRTTLTIDSDVAHMVKEAMRRDGVTMKELVNRSLRAMLNGLAPAPKRKPYVLKTSAMGMIHPDRLPTHVLAELDEEEDIRRYGGGK